MNTTNAERLNSKTIKCHMENHISLHSVNAALRLSKLSSVQNTECRKLVTCSISGRPTLTRDSVQYVPKVPDFVFYCPVTPCKSLCKTKKLFRQHLNRVHTVKNTSQRRKRTDFVISTQNTKLRSNILLQLLPRSNVFYLTQAPSI